MHCESEALVKSAQFVIIIQTQMQASSGRLLCMPPGPSCGHAVTTEQRQKVRQMCRDVGLYICI